MNNVRCVGESGGDSVVGEERHSGDAPWRVTVAG
uniref:Uncharacterized protein n=1 Tax=Cutibacterium phage vB_CacS-HV1 TaxID=3236917 RepID=A0AB39CFB9_9CAUD